MSEGRSRAPPLLWFFRVHTLGIVRLGALHLPVMESNQKDRKSTSWVCVGGSDDIALADSLAAGVKQWAESSRMPLNEPERVSEFDTNIVRGSLVLSPHRLELLRRLCHVYSAGVRSERISSHRPILGPAIVFAKKILFRIVSPLLGPSFKHQREFNAAVIKLLGDLCNEATESNQK